MSRIWLMDSEYNVLTWAELVSDSIAQFKATLSRCAEAIGYNYENVVVRGENGLVTVNGLLCDDMKLIAWARKQ